MSTVTHLPQKKTEKQKIENKKKLTLQQVAVGRDRGQQRQEDERLEREHLDYLRCVVVSSKERGTSEKGERTGGKRGRAHEFVGEGEEEALTRRR